MPRFGRRMLIRLRYIPVGSRNDGYVLEKADEDTAPSVVSTASDSPILQPAWHRH
jgi:hypothetical protein